jgi:ankyrin repeat protein
MAALSSVQQVFRAVAAGDDASLRRAFGLNPALLHAKHPRNGHTLLHAAAALGNLPLLRDLLHAGASCQARDGHDETPLHVAARQVNPKPSFTANQFISRSPAAASCIHSSKATLYQCVNTLHTFSLLLIIINHINTSINQSSQGCTAVVRELLTDAGRRSCMRAANHEGATPLHLAVMGHHGDAVRLLLNAGARADMRDKV